MTRRIKIPKRSIVIGVRKVFKELKLKGEPSLLEFVESAAKNSSEGNEIEMGMCGYRNSVGSSREN